jgi:hypothetical protein
MSNPAILFSYIDPVSGVILLQLLIGGCIGGFTFFCRKLGFGWRRQTNPPTNAEAPNESAPPAEISSMKQQP